MKKICESCILRSVGCVFIKENTEDKCETVKHYDEGYNDAFNDAVEYLETNLTFEHPRKSTKECIVNIRKFREFMNEKNEIIKTKYNV